MGCDHAGHQHGRRVEKDKSWTVYLVFARVPAAVDGYPMTGLNGLSAMSCTVFLNFHSAEHRAIKWPVTYGMPNVGRVATVDIRCKF